MLRDRRRTTDQDIRRRSTRAPIGKRLVAGTGVVALSLLGGISAATTASAAPGDISNASARYLSGTLLGTNLDNIAAIGGVSGTNNGTVPVDDPSATQFNPLDLSVLGDVVTLTAPGGVQIPVDFASVGVVGQYASAAPDGSSRAAAGLVGGDGAVGVGPVPGQVPGPLRVNLSNAVDSLLGSGIDSLVGEIASLDLTLGVTTASAQLDGFGNLERDYSIAGGQLVIGSEFLAELSTTLNGVVEDLENLQDDVNGSVEALLGLLDGVVDANLTVDATSVTNAVQALLTEPLTGSYPGVSIDLDAGQILVDLDTIQPLNGLGEGTEILSTETLGEIVTAVNDIVGGLTSTVNSTIIPAIENLAITGNVTIVLLVLPVELIEVDTTVGALLDGDLSGVEILDLGLGNVPLVGEVVAALLAPVNLILDPLRAIATNTVQEVLDLLALAIDTVLPLVASLTVNNQTGPGDAGVYSETAAILTVLPTIDAATINLATATVGPNSIVVSDVAITSPEDGAEFEAPDETGSVDVTVTGTGEPGATVTVSIPDQTPQTPVVTPEGTWSATFADLPPGTYTATASQTFAGESSSDTVTFTVVEAEVVAVDITAPEDGTIYTVLTDDATQAVTVSGTGEPGETVTVTLDSGDELTDVVDDEGAWSVTFDALPVDAYTATAVQDVDGEETSDTVSFEIVSSEVTPVDILLPVDGAEFTVATDDGEIAVTVSGDGEPGAAISVVIPGVGELDTVVLESGTWSVTFDDVPVGDYTATATQTDDAGVETTDAVGFSVVSTEITAVAITAPTPDQVFEVATDDGTADVIVSGEGEPGASVEVTVTGEDAQTVPVTPEGTWTATFPGLPVGDYTATATQTSGDDVTTDSVDFEVFSTEVTAVDIATPTAGQVFVVPTDDGSTDVVVAGTGEPGATVVVSIPGEGELEADVMMGGTWSVTFEDVEVGEYTATATQTSGDDITSDSVDFEVFSTEVTDVEITTPSDGQTFTVTTDDGTQDVTVTGTGEPGATVDVAVTGEETQTVPVNDEGDWTATFPGLPVGDYTVTATQDEGDGSTDTVTFEIISSEITAVDITAPIPNQEFDVATDDGTIAVTVSGTGEPGASVVVTIPDEDPQTATVTEAGTWEVTFLGLPVGVYTATATQTPGGTTDSVTFEVVSTEVTDVVILTPEDGEEFTVPGEDDTITVTVTGEGEPAAEIEVTIPGTDITDTVTVGENGEWEATLEDVPVGEHTITATQDEDGSTDEIVVTVVVEGAVDADAADADATDADATDADAADADAADADATDADAADADAADADATDADAADADATDADADATDADATDADSTDADATDADATDADATDADATDADATDADATDADATDADAVDADAIDADATDADATDADATDADATDADATDADATDADATDADATDADAVDADATDADATDADATDADATDADATDADATDADSTDADATDADATDADATDADATDADATDADATDATDADAADADATDADATDADATDADATDADATDADAVDADATDADATDADVDATDADATDADATDADATDADAVDADAADADATDADATDADAVDADATDADATDADAVDADATDADATDATDADATDADAVDADATDADATDATDGSETFLPEAEVTQPRITRGPNAVQVVLGTGFAPGETVSATVNSTPFALTPVVADAAGNVRFSFAVGPDFELGAHRVELSGSISGELPADRERTAFTVLERELPPTGSDVNGLLLGGAGAIALLAGAVLVTTRRKKSASS